jgi:DNA repair protein RadD
VIDNQHNLRVPDFVIAKRDKHKFKVLERIFDYTGRYRKANEL